MITALWVILGLMITYTLGVGLFERLAPRTWVRSYQRTVNPFFRHWTGRAHGWAVLETVGRVTGRAHETPVGGRLIDGRTYWFVAGDAAHSDFVRNIEANPRVRLRVHGRWHEGIATPMPEDHARRRLLRLNPFNSAFVAIAARDPMTVRVDLGPSLD